MNSPVAGLPRSRSRRLRSGWLLIVVVVFLAILVATVVAATRLVLSERQQITLRHHQLQAARLADAAIDRAAVRLAVDPAWSGEAWRPAVDKDRSAIIDIEVVRGDAGVVVRAAARYPADARRSVLVRREIEFEAE